MNRSSSASPSVGRTLGISVRLHWSSAIVGALIAWFVAELLEAATGPLPLSVRASLGLLGALALGVSILGHELAHALAARRCGLRVEAIGLEIFGGAAYLLDEPRRPRHAFGVAAAGPAASIVMGVVAFGLSRALDAVGAPEALVLLVAWLAMANVALALFNLLPGLPLDGGRMLEAVLWHRRGEHAAATVTAAAVGVVVGLLVIAYGVSGVLVGGFGGLWTMFVGWMLYSSAAQERQRAKAMRSLAGLTVADVMSSPVDTVEDYLSIADFGADQGGLRARSSYPVRAFSGRIVGLVVTSAVAERVRRSPEMDTVYTTVRQFMVPAEQLQWAKPDEWLTDVVGRGHPGALGRILVGDEDALVGIVTPSDLAKACYRWPRSSPGSDVRSGPSVPASVASRLP